jgi:sulfite exporter TauE/SafE
MAAAVFLFFFGLSRLGLFREPQWMSLASPEKIPGYERVIKTAVGERRHTSMFLLGLMLGFLPCGLSFAAFARALGTGGVLSGSVLVFAFGMGTLPGLLVVGTGASKVARRYRKHSDILSGMMMILMGLSLAADAIQTMDFR